MSKDQQPEELRPIPDGGLKDTMPGWLNRPPAWRNMPSAEQRHERTLPEPDTSEIDPKSLVDVSDLPQWLQTIAARGEVPIPEPDQTVGYALQQLEAAKARTRSEAEEPIDTEPTLKEPEDMVLPNEQNPAFEEKVDQTAPAATDESVAQEDVEVESKPMPTAMVLALCALIAIVIVVAYILV